MDGILSDLKKGSIWQECIVVIEWHWCRVKIFKYWECTTFVRTIEQS